MVKAFCIFSVLWTHVILLSCSIESSVAGRLRESRIRSERSFLNPTQTRNANELDKFDNLNNFDFDSTAAATAAKFSTISSQQDQDQEQLRDYKPKLARNRSFSSSLSFEEESTAKDDSESVSQLLFPLLFSTSPPSTSPPTSISKKIKTMQRAHIFVTGKVQGVYYRDSTKKKAELLGLVGAAWNLKDGRVEIIAEGTKDKLDELERWCHLGPEGAKEVGLDNDLTAKRKVDSVEITFEAAKGDLGRKFKNGGSK
ncbi:unnamed protein product [Amoebophrya sp. A120]|nr:unnamed protein product [Amoebophrya sp. A120]|eukprot:GSA120T00009631001.1